MPRVSVPHVHAALDHLENNGHRILHAVTNGPTRHTTFYNYHGQPVAEFSPRRGLNILEQGGPALAERPDSGQEELEPLPERDYQDEGRQVYNQSRGIGGKGMSNKRKKRIAMSNKAIALANHAMIQPSSTRAAEARLSPGHKILSDLRNRVPTSFSRKS